MSHNPPAGDPPETCVVCGDQTATHPVPHGFLCHSCYQNEPADSLLDAVPTEAIDGDTSAVRCAHCGEEQSLLALFWGHVTVITGPGCVEIGSYDGVALGVCSCGATTDHLTTPDARQNIRQNARHVTAYEKSRTGLLSRREVET